MRRRTMWGAILAVIVVAAIVGLGVSQGWFGGSPATLTPSAAASASPSDIRTLFEDRRSGVEVHATGTVSRILPDDTEGSRHQRFILTLPDGLTVLVAHNIDIAPRLDGLTVGDTVGFLGEYEWNAQGGTVHWTHHDPAGRHEAGWLRWGGRTYG